LATNQQDLSTIISNSRAISADLKEKLEAVESKDLREAFDSMRVSLNNLEHISGAIDPKQLKRDLEELDKALQAFADMRSQDPDRDVPNLIRRTMQRIDRMTAALEREAQEESLLRLMLSDLDIDRDPRPSHADSEPACR
jgi:uncharacterized membrane protein YccC